MNKYFLGGSIIIIVIVGVMFYILGLNVGSKNTVTKSSESSDQKLLNTGNEALDAIKSADFKKLEKLVSSAGLSWDHYIYVNLTDPNYNIPKDQISSIPTDSKKYAMGYGDGTGSPIEVTRSEYFQKYIFNHEYTDATKTKITIIKPSASINELDKFFVEANNESRTGGFGERAVIGYHFKESTITDPSGYGTLYLIFDDEKGEYKLRGIARYYWTI